MSPDQEPSPIDPVPSAAMLPSAPTTSSRRRWMLMGGVGLAVLLLGLVGFVWTRNGSEPPAAKQQQQAVTTPQASTKATVQGLQLDTAKAYGDKYANGLLPVGDKQYTTGGAEKGKVYLCQANFVPESQAGAQTRGPWFVGTTQWNINKKYAVQGSVQWQQKLSHTVSGDKRIIATNNLPDHVTGTFPVASTDPAAQYDRNPNTIKSQSLTYTVASNPTYGAPQCMGGEVGVMLTGVALFNAFDAGGRDAGAWEIQDGCEGHPQSSGLYHYHTLSSCVKDVSVGTVIGFALDGFPITGPKVRDGHVLTTSDLDECHGIVSEITLDGKKVTQYHYVMTQDFPYSVGCFRATAAQAPGQHSGGQQGMQPSAPGQPAQQGPPPPGAPPKPPRP